MSCLKACWTHFPAIFSVGGSSPLPYSPTKKGTCSATFVTSFFESVCVISSDSGTIGLKGMVLG